MIEKICPVHNVPVIGENCSLDGCHAKPIISTTVYWCNECNVPSFYDTCHRCGSKCTYISTDLRPVFPEERLLLAILWEKSDLHVLDSASIWAGNNGYFIDGKRIKFSVKKFNQKSIETIRQYKDIYDRNINAIDDTVWKQNIKKFIEVNEDRYHEITDEAISYIQGFQNQYTLDDMFVSFSGGKDSTVVSDLVTRGLSSNKVTHIFGDTTLEFPTTYEYRARFSKQHRVIRAKNYEKNFEEEMTFYKKILGNRENSA